MLLSHMSAHGIPSTEDFAAAGVCAWYMTVNLQFVLSQFFPSTHHCNAVFDLATKRHN
jgi:hypothetical protein